LGRYRRQRSRRTGARENEIRIRAASRRAIENLCETGHRDFFNINRCRRDHKRITNRDRRAHARCGCRNTVAISNNHCFARANGRYPNTLGISPGDCFTDRHGAGKEIYTAAGSYCFSDCLARGNIPARDFRAFTGHAAAETPARGPDRARRPRRTRGPAKSWSAIQIASEKICATGRDSNVALPKCE
jgi:hypothetical protein